MRMISARFESKCPNCFSQITAGTTVAWTKGSPARHVVCQAGNPPVEVPDAIPDMGHVGTIGAEISLDLEITKVRDLVGQYGASRMHLMRDSAGRVFVWYASTARLNAGQTVRLTGKVKAHNTYAGVSQTVLTRCQKR